MNKTHHILFMVLVLLLLPLNSGAQTKRALLVGISNYSSNRATQWTDIHGANDVEMIATTLKSQKFKITKITNQQATAKRIRTELASLVKSCRAGDVVYIHFSGHGQPVEDQNKDEADGWDEAIIPYDAQKFYKKGVYEGANHILDDELNVSFNKLRKKVGPKGVVCVVIDACHAGDIYRGDDDEETFCRGTIYTFSPSGKAYEPRKNADSNFRKFGIKQIAGYSDILILEACRSYQSNHEIKYNGQYHGPLSYYVNKTLQSQKLMPSLRWVNQIMRLMDGDIHLSKQQMVFETTLK